MRLAVNDGLLFPANLVALPAGAPSKSQKRPPALYESAQFSLAVVTGICAAFERFLNTRGGAACNAGRFSADHFIKFFDLTLAVDLLSRASVSRSTLDQAEIDQRSNMLVGGGLHGREDAEASGARVDWHVARRLAAVR
jgi:hypothetical protein